MKFYIGNESIYLFFPMYFPGVFFVVRFFYFDFFITFGSDVFNLLLVGVTVSFTAFFSSWTLQFELVVLSAKSE